MGTIHAGRMETSPRLTRVYEALRSAGAMGLSTWQIVAACRVCAVNSIIAELRAGGHQIDCKDEGKNEQGARIFRYRLVVAGKGELFAG